MREVEGGIKGERLRWAREQLGLTLRDVVVRGGPSIAFQCEVEKQKKTEVSTKMLAAWVEILQVTPEFARGMIPRYAENPVACWGLAGDISHLTERSEPVPQARLHALLRLIATRSQKLPRVVLAYTLGLEVDSLDEVLAGTFPISKPQKEALLHLAALDDSFLALSEPGLTPEEKEMQDQYLYTIQLARHHGLPPDKLAHLIRTWSAGPLPGSNEERTAVAGSGPAGSG